MKILSETELRSRFAHYSEFKSQSSSFVRRYSLSRTAIRKNDFAKVLTDALHPMFPMFAFFDPSDIRRHSANANHFEVWRKYLGDPRTPDVAPYYLFESTADRASFDFVVSLSLNSSWRTCLWTMDASATVQLLGTGLMHVNCNRSDFCHSLDEDFRELAIDTLLCSAESATQVKEKDFQD